MGIVVAGGSTKALGGAATTVVSTVNAATLGGAGDNGPDTAISPPIDASAAEGEGTGATNELRLITCIDTVPLLSRTATHKDPVTGMFGEQLGHDRAVVLGGHQRALVTWVGKRLGQLRALEQFTNRCGGQRDAHASTTPR